ncbi:hypothetical protein [Sporolactobacillus sp. KGMB 08714]|uniref:hypothetical protein n=1 Tax=Sporolactobacillus sp. KGMB 08714 TaxID=3064704 RepID=UPI002FBDC3FB
MVNDKVVHLFKESDQNRLSEVEKINLVNQLLKEKVITDKEAARIRKRILLK